MIDITYLDGAKQERVMHFDSYDEFERSQQACLIGVADFYPVVKLTYNGHELDYQGPAAAEATAQNVWYGL